ncbi:hypothetical protein KXD40_001813 [Peronospora effusa]|uniref:RBR-type E3 ubiquitin transferase n=1 Tax=Peronospora effusa TaxID=542832 RepID=A0A3M6VB97_9STRA|nr:hypothetical protein DD238_004939 [Peronospora effusa]RQM09177.1 hypothetical protein DD237_000361 [Peronospora effusa]UIZ26393.1 hypothetical protein KXD40_001813 [Peronospora effusa]CAI5704803.1 unnamed protein product [Peronospora effusa]
MEIAIRRQTFCGKSHLHYIKTQRSSLSKLDDEEQLQVPLPSSQAPRSIQLLHKSAMLELFQEQQRRSSIPTLRRSNTRRPSTCVLVGRNLDSETEEYEPKQVDIPIICLSAPSNVMADGFDTTGQRECQICFDKLDASQAHACVSCCGSFCASCTRWYIEYKVLEGEVSQKKMVCPAPRCKNPLSEELVQALVSPEIFGKYKTFLKNQRVGIRFCPRAGCCAILDEPLNSSTRRVKCQTCKQESCMRCGDDFHKIPTCRHVEKRFGHWKKRHNVRGCPSCKAVIEKQGGCSHMKCFQCDEEFCWSCLRPWHNHDETLCLPLSFLRSKNQKYGCWAPMRVVTKTAIVGVAAVAAVAGVGLAVVVLPPVLGFQYAKDSYRRRKYARSSYICVAEWDTYLH